MPSCDPAKCASCGLAPEVKVLCGYCHDLIARIRTTPQDARWGAHISEVQTIATTAVAAVLMVTDTPTQAISLIGDLFVHIIAVMTGDGTLAPTAPSLTNSPVDPTVTRH